MNDELVQQVRRRICVNAAERARFPEAADLAIEMNVAVGEIESAYRRLADEHIVVLRPGTLSLWSAPPFSAVPTDFRVRMPERSWFAPCAWDAFGIPALLAIDAAIEARDGWTALPLECGVAEGRAFGDAIIHLAVPAARFWDDIFYT